MSLRPARQGLRPAAAPSLLYLVTEDRFFVSHFLPFAKEAVRCGFQVRVATRVSQYRSLIEAEGIAVIPFENERRSLGPLELLRSLWRLTLFLRTYRPDVVHAISLRMVILGGVACLFAPPRRIIFAPTGLGHLWVHDGIMERLARWITRALIRTCLQPPSSRYLFENADDPAELGVRPERVTLIAGAGVDPAQFSVTPEPEGEIIKIAVVSRMTRPKGIPEAITALKLARQAGANAELHLFGAPDPSNRLSLGADQLQGLEAEGIFWHGPTSDIAGVWKTHHIALLLSHREGLPRSLIEAIASGRPVITTTVTGCRDIIRDHQDGLLVPPRQPEAAAQAIVSLCRDARQRQRMGQAARQRFETHFTLDAVLATYRHLLCEEPCR